MNKLLNFENVIKFTGGIVAICGLYYALDKRLALIEQKFDYYISMNVDKEKEARFELFELKVTDKELLKEVTELKLRIAKLYAVLPKKLKLEDENN